MKSERSRRMPSRDPHAAGFANSYSYTREHTVA